MKLVLTGDLHGNLPEIPPCDLLLMAGDIGPIASNKDCANWLDNIFRVWLVDLYPTPVIGIAGNHDFIFKAAYGRGIVNSLPWTYLEDSGTSVKGLNIWGSPWTPKFGRWAFQKEDNELAPIWEKIPTETDILIIHGPPKGILDENFLGDHVGSQSLMNELTKRMSHGIKLPRLIVMGHVHEEGGKTFIPNNDPLYQTIFVNASRMTLQYEPLNPIMEIEL